jgi:hypothetical protein
MSLVSSSGARALEDKQRWISDLKAGCSRPASSARKLSHMQIQNSTSMVSRKQTSTWRCVACSGMRYPRQ